MPDQRNLILAVVISVGIILAFNLLYEGPRQKRLQEETGTQPPPQAETVDLPRPQAPEGPAVPRKSASARPGPDRAGALAQSPRVRIESARLSGSIALTGGRIDDVTLVDYRETVEKDSPRIVLLSPRGSERAYFAEFSWVNAKGQNVALPDNETVWRADADTLTPDRPVTLTWDNDAGLTFKRTYEIDRNYMLTVTQRVTNDGGESITLYPFGLIWRGAKPTDILGFWILHEGPLGVFDGTLEEHDYEDLVEARTIKRQTTGGWIGITDKYWLVALVPDQAMPATARFVHFEADGNDRYQVDYLGANPMVIAGGASIEARNRLFVGAKEAKLLDRYTEELGIARFDLAIDWGWFYWFTRPIFVALDYLNHVLGNFGLAILVLTVAIKLVFFPLANKSYRAMSAMKKLQPQMTELRELYGDDKQRMNQELMALYKREKVNPAAGCLPIVIQIPVFFALYKVLFVTIEMRHAPFYGWIQDLSARDPTSLFNLFGLIPWDPPAMLAIGAWPLIMGLTMFLQQKLNPQPADPMQAKLFLALPVVFTVLLAQFPAGLVIYWAWNNLLSIAQQWVIMQRYGASAKKPPAVGLASSAASSRTSGAAPAGASGATSGEAPDAAASTESRATSAAAAGAASNPHTVSQSKPKPRSKSKTKPRSKSRSKPKSGAKS